MQHDESHLYRVLALVPTARDAEVTHTLLESCGLSCTLCRSPGQAAMELHDGAGTLLLTEEALVATGIDEVLTVLDAQPAWSELPVIMLMRGGSQSPSAAPALDRMGNVIILDRPASRRSMLSAVNAAIRSRRRQYESRNQIDQIRRGEKLRTKLLENERESRREAERASRMKDEFLATLSHELRTPLTAVLGWAQMLHRAKSKSTGSGGAVKEDDPALIQHGLEVIERNARLQSEIIEDLLDMSRIISGKVRLQMRNVHPSEIVEAAVDSIRPAMEAKAQRLHVRIEKEADAIVGDAGRLQQVLYNLLTNAVKFTPQQGEIDVTCCRQNQHIEVAVHDTGMGIRKEFLPYVFERFRQQDASSTRAFGGLGLGLAIVKQLVELHGGAVAVTSEGQDQGSTFKVCLPISPPIEQEDDAERSPGFRQQTAHASSGPVDADDPVLLAGVRVLVVDDELDARDLLQRILQRSGADVRVACSGREGLDTIEQCDCDIVISDIGMPEMDGYEFIRNLRSRSHGEGGDTPAIALTAFARTEDRLRTIGAGFQKYLTKPVEPDMLLGQVVELVRGTDAHSNERARRH